MSDDWPVSIEGREFYPVPESWIDHGSDDGRGAPRAFAVSVAAGVRNMIVLRYATRDGRVYRVQMSGSELEDGGTVPASLATYHDWPRSLVPGENVESSDVIRAVESEHMREIWDDRLEEPAGAEPDDQLIADGGSPRESNATEQIECTNMECSGEAEYGYWLPDFGHFSRVRNPEHDLLDDGDLAPYVCESCRDRMADSPHWDGSQFVRPVEKLVADGGTVSECPECGSSSFYPNGGLGAYWCESCEREFWKEGSGWYSCGVDGEPRRVAEDGSSDWSPSDLGLDVPAVFEDVSVSNSDLRVDVDALQEETDVDLRDPDELAEERDAALESAIDTVDDVPAGRFERSAMDSLCLEAARDSVVGAMRAEYLRRNYQQTGGENA